MLDLLSSAFPLSDETALRSGQTSPVLDFHHPILVFDDPGVLQAKHLVVVIGVISGRNTVLGQNLPGDVVMTIPWLTLHPKCLGTVFVQKVPHRVELTAESAGVQHRWGSPQLS